MEETVSHADWRDYEKADLQKEWQEEEKASYQKEEKPVDTMKNIMICCYCLSV